MRRQKIKQQENKQAERKRGRETQPEEEASANNLMKHQYLRKIQEEREKRPMKGNLCGNLWPHTDTHTLGVPRFT